MGVSFSPVLESLLTGQSTFKMPNKADSDSEANETDCRVGLCFRPRWARRLASPKLLLACYGLLHLAQGMKFTLCINTMTTVERHFQLKSETLGQVLSFADIAPTFLSVIFGYWCGGKDRPRWIGGLSLFIALGCVISALPYFIYGAPDDKQSGPLTNTKDNGDNTSISGICIPRHNISLAYNADITNSTEGNCVQNLASENGNIAAAIYLIGLTMFNCASTVMWIVGTPYLDDSATPKNSPFYIAIVSALHTIGPLLGSLLSSVILSYYVNLSQTDLTPEDPRWVGAWWLGFVIIAPIIAFVGFLVAQFPERLSSEHAAPEMEMVKASKQPQIESTYDAEVSSRWSKIQAVLIDFFREMWYLLKNRHWLLRTASGIATVMALESFMIYFAKYLENQFHLTASQASAWSGTALLFPAIIGQVCVGFFMKHFVPSSRKLATMLACAKLLITAMYLALMFMQCSSSYIVGIHEESRCDIDCECPSLPFQPVCVEGHRNFLSGCHAGCTSFNTSGEANKYVNCSCSRDGYAIPGFCSESCSLFPYYIALICLGHFIISIDVESVIFLFRCVPVEKKTMSLGMFSACVSLIAFIPAPLIFSAIIDAACILWNVTCNMQGACLVYDIDQFRYLIHGMPILLLGIAFVCDTLFAMKAHEIELYNED